MDVFARSIPGQGLSLDVGGGPQDVAVRGGTGDSRNYFVRVDTGNTVPQKVTVENTDDPVVDPPMPPTEATVTDAVEITRADYDSAARTLTVVAESSDQASPRTLTLTGVGSADTTLDGTGGATLPGIDAPPPVVTVFSDAGGSTTRTVTVVG